jgi:putative oxygen-independent coproporphyrinogen III oxidase
MGLYIHIPFCSRLCHYCDFVKTARFEAQGPEAYLRTIEVYADAWIQALHQKFPEGWAFDTLFFGGGTPSLLDEAYRPLMQKLRPWLRNSAEVTLEANPEHVTAEKLKVWADLGINRLSLGVQSFQAQGLEFLTREHRADAARQAVALAGTFIPNINIDLIYGWQGQELEHWAKDLQEAMSLDIKHLSLYTLTYEGRTPLARKQRRGVLEATGDDLLESMYREACQFLKKRGWQHEEVSNWHRPGFASVHNSIYWHSNSYIGMGNGSHSFLREVGGPWGIRWSQDASLRILSDGQKLLSSGLSVEQLLLMPGVHIESGRTGQEWLLETVSSGLRTTQGINVNAICAKTGYSFRPRPALLEALRQGLMHLDSQGILTLKEEEWYRETGWALEASLSFTLS